MGPREGFFCAAYALRSQHDLNQLSSDQLEDFLSWVRTNLTVPDRFNRTSSKGGGKRRDTKGLSWFKPTANDALVKAYELIALLELHGYVIDTLRSDNVGYVVYEDDAQVVAEPFANTPV